MYRLEYGATAEAGYGMSLRALLASTGKKKKVSEVAPRILRAAGRAASVRSIAGLSKIKVRDERIV